MLFVHPLTHKGPAAVLISRSAHLSVGLQWPPCCTHLTPSSQRTTCDRLSAASDDLRPYGLPHLPSSLGRGSLCSSAGADTRLSLRSNIGAGIRFSLCGNKFAGTGFSLYGNIGAGTGFRLCSNTGPGTRLRWLLLIHQAKGEMDFCLVVHVCCKKQICASASSHVAVLLNVQASKTVAHQ